MTITNNRFFLSDFVSIQRNSFLQFLEKGLIEEISKRNPITNSSNTLEVFFYAQFYQLTAPKYNIRQAIIKNKSYTSRLYIPVQLTDKEARVIKIKWVYLCDLPIMTKRGHFIINGAARVIVNQIIRSPGIYYQTKLYEKFANQWSETAENSLERHYADLICQRGTWLRLEIDKQRKIWGQTKKGPKIPIMWLLLAMGLNEKIIFESVLDPTRLLYNMYDLEEEPKNSWNTEATIRSNGVKYTFEVLEEQRLNRETQKKQLPPYVKTPSEAWEKIYQLYNRASAKKLGNSKSQKQSSKVLRGQAAQRTQTIPESELGRQLIFNLFLNPRTYDLSKHGRMNFNKKFNLSISTNQTTLTPQDLLAATDHLLKVEFGLKKIDDIDNLKNRRVRTSGELIQLQFGIGLLRLEKSIQEKFTNMIGLHTPQSRNLRNLGVQTPSPNPNWGATRSLEHKNFGFQELESSPSISLGIHSLIPNTKPVNSALREFFGTSPLSQFMDQINPLAEITHKRRLSSMGPGGVTRDSATLDIRGIHPSHYGRICPVETPEGKNTGLVNSLTTYARVNKDGYIETPFYKVYKGQVQKKLGMFFFSAEKEEKLRLGAADLFISDIGFLSKANLPVRIEEDFTKIPRTKIQYTGVAASQMVSIATSLIPFLEHDDGNRALMGSNMQRQAVPLLLPERPIVGTSLEARVVSDSGHALQVKQSGVVTYVSSTKVVIAHKG